MNMADNSRNLKLAIKKEDVQIDSSGKIVITDPELAAAVKKELDSDVSGYGPTDDVNVLCAGCGCK
jgi:hypothetical protein